jgi:hypothetical protein
MSKELTARIKQLEQENEQLKEQLNGNGKYKYAVVREFPDSQMVVGIGDNVNILYDNIQEFYDKYPDTSIKYNIIRLRLTGNEQEEK